MGLRKAHGSDCLEIIDPKGFWRVRMHHNPDASGESLMPFVCDVVVPNSIVHSDGWSAYRGFPNMVSPEKITDGIIFRRSRTCIHAGRSPYSEFIETLDIGERAKVQ